MKLVKVKVTNFKSLRDVSVNGFSDVNMIYGMNNSGKSNLLKFLELVFKRKEKKEVVTFQDGSEEVTEVVDFYKTNFWDGNIFNAPYLFWMDDSSQDISFSIRIEVNEGELKTFNKELFDDLVKGKAFDGLQSYQFEFNGNINSIGDSDSEIILKTVRLGLKEIYNEGEGGVPQYFHENPDISEKYSEQGFYDLITNFNDCIELIDSDRYFKKELYKLSSNDVELTPSTLKNWLYENHLSSKSYKEFVSLQKFLNQIEIGSNLKERAKGKLDNFPLEKLEVSFSRFGDELEVMLTTRIGRLPLKNHGTGVQQLIYLFTKIFESNSKIFVIEEAELNLSKEYQEVIIHNMKRLIDEGLINQFIFTSHSDVFRRNDYPHFEVTQEADGATKINKVENKRTGLEKIAMD